MSKFKVIATYTRKRNLEHAVCRVEIVKGKPYFTQYAYGVVAYTKDRLGKEHVYDFCSYYGHDWKFLLKQARARARRLVGPPSSDIFGSMYGTRYTYVPSGFYVK